PAARRILGCASRWPERGADGCASDGVSSEGRELSRYRLRESGDDNEYAAHAVTALYAANTVTALPQLGNNSTTPGTGCAADGLFSAEMDRQDFLVRAGLSQGERNDSNGQDIRRGCNPCSDSIHRECCPRDDGSCA